MQKSILIVEDEKKIACLLVDYFQNSGYETHHINDGNQVIDAVKSLQPSAILLDVMLPGKNGLTLCKEIRTFSQVPILMVTARVEEIDRLLGLELGADDYICKPFSPREVVARVKAILRRHQRTDNTHDPDLLLDDHKYVATYKSIELDLTAVEFQLLKQLVSDPGRIFSRDQLMNHMYKDRRVVSDRTIDSHVKKLRKKFAKHFPNTELIFSFYGVGYKYDIAEHEQD